MRKAKLLPEAAELLQIAGTYESVTGNQRTTLASRVARNADFFENIENGGGFNIKTYHKIKDWFHQNIPNSAASQHPPPS